MFLAIEYEVKNEELKELVKSELREQGVEPITGEDLSKNPPPPVIRDQILTSDGLLALITSDRSDWIQNEVGIAYAAKKTICALVETIEPRIHVGGVLPLICKFRSFSRSDKVELRKLLVEILTQFDQAAQLRTRGIVESQAHFRAPWIVEGDEMLASTDDHSSRYSISIHVRPRQIPQGDEVINIYVPPQFDLTGVLFEQTDRQQNSEKTENWRTLETDLPEPDSNITIGLNTSQHPYPEFWFIRACLSFPKAGNWLRGGWFRIKLLDVVAPKIAGSYRFYGTDDISAERAFPAASTQPYDFHPIIVKGEVTTASLYGTISLPDGSPLTLPGFVRAEGIAVDPWLPDCPSTGRYVTAISYISPSQKGQYAIPGMAPGRYTVYAGALRYSEFIVANSLLVKERTLLDGKVALEMRSYDRATIGRDVTFRQPDP